MPHKAANKLTFPPGVTTLIYADRGLTKHSRAARMVCGT